MEHMSHIHPSRLLTLGHGTSDQTQLRERMNSAGIALVVDVRRHPGSRRHPHVARAALTAWLPEAGIAYEWHEDLGGRRSGPPDSPDVALRNASFRGYARHMRTAAFAAALQDVLARAETTTAAVMCSESLWWRCHRRMIADAAVLLHGARIEHVLPDGRTAEHEPTAGVRVASHELVYDRLTQPRLPAGRP
jgi:uncharacterized protein (DUF488 family)